MLKCETFICRITGLPFVGMSSTGITTCSFPVVIEGSEGDNLQRVIIRGTMAARCLSRFESDTTIQVFGVRKIRPLQYGHGQETYLEEIVAWSAKPHGPKQKELKP